MKLNWFWLDRNTQSWLYAAFSRFQMQLWLRTRDWERERGREGGREGERERMRKWGKDWKEWFKAKINVNSFRRANFFCRYLYISKPKEASKIISGHSPFKEFYRAKILPKINLQMEGEYVSRFILRYQSFFSFLACLQKYKEQKRSWFFSNICILVVIAIKYFIKLRYNFMFSHTHLFMWCILVFCMKKIDLDLY